LVLQAAQVRRSPYSLGSGRVLWHAYLDVLPVHWFVSRHGD
jgi:hypothetical protein